MQMIHKAARAAGDGLTFVLSDATRDRYGDEIVADGWDLKSFRQNPIALFGHSSAFPIGKWANLRVEGGKLLGDLKLAARGTSQRIDELISLVEQGILRAVSVGFMPIESEPLEGGGRRYKRQELLETSLVSVPANPSALQVAKGIGISDDTLSLAFDEHVNAGGEVGRGNSGEHAEHRAMQGRASPNQVRSERGLPAVPTGVRTMKTLSQRIEDAQEDLTRAKDALTEHLKEDDADSIVTEEMSSQIEAKETSLAALKRAESALAAKTAPQGQPALPAVRRPLGVQQREPKRADLVVRAAAAHAIAYATGKDLDAVLERHWGGHEETHVVTKAAVAGATTTADGWASQLVQEAMADFLETLRPISIYPTLASAGGQLTFGPNSGSIRIPSRASTPSISGSFVAEGAPIPVRRMGLTSIALSPHKMGVISVFSRELARYSTPAIEGLIRQEMLADTAITMDTLLLDNTAGSTTRPAGLLNGVTPITESALGGYQAVLDDLDALFGPFDTANAGRNLVVIMNPAQARALNMTPGPDGTFGWADRFLNGVTRIVSSTVTAGTVIAVDAADFVTATGAVPEFDVSEQAVLHMEDTTPAQISTAGTPPALAHPTQSMFQTAQLAVRMLMDVTWAMRRAGMVQVVEDVTWGDVVGG